MNFALADHSAIAALNCAKPENHYPDAVAGKPAVMGVVVRWKSKNASRRNLV